MISKSKIELLRTPRELRQFVLTTVRFGKSDKSVRHTALLKKEGYKQFQEEIVPLSRFCEMYTWGQNVRVRPVLGNQQYDAVVVNECGAEVTRIELAYPHNGKREAHRNQQVVNDGIIDIFVTDIGGDLDELIECLIISAEKKSKIKYVRCMLVFTLDYLKPYEEHESIYEDKLLNAIDKIETLKFHADRVFLLDSAMCKLRELRVNRQPPIFLNRFVRYFESLAS